MAYCIASSPVLTSREALGQVAVSAALVCHCCFAFFLQVNYWSAVAPERPPSLLDVYGFGN